MSIFIIIVYGLSLLFIFLFSMGQLHLTLHYLKAGKNSKDDKVEENPLPSPPNVTIQLPLYNEKYVAERLIHSICNLNYPADKLEIQVLDDSTDETVDIVSRLVALKQEKGINIQHIQRPDRKGFKAGALEYGMNQCKGMFIAIFDADFLPEKDFLIKTIPLFSDENVGVVQTRWGHINKDYSMLTQLQAFGLDAHFSVEQTGRSHAGSFINFNGTAGVWRKKCITDAGGWSADTLTEDLDLSYRAQLKGWKFKYLEEVESPAELPVLMSAIKGQQYRWNKGAAETARKNLMKVLKSKMSFSTKFHAFFHLLNSSVFVSLLLAALLSVPVLFIKAQYPEYQMLFHLGGILLLGFFSISWFYWVASKKFNKNKPFTYYLKTYPMFLIVSMGLSLHNGMAVLEGIVGIKSEFIRTPKFNILSGKDSWVGNTYIFTRIKPLTLVEGLLTLYFLGGIAVGIYLKDPGLMIFHSMLALGFGIVFFYSLTQRAHGQP